MRYLSAFLISLFAFTAAFSQTEQSPIVEREFDYKDWTYKQILSDDEINLRSAASDKKLVMIVYFAPWCPNWKHDAAFVQKLHEKYADKGLVVIGIGEYDSTSRMRSHLDQYKITFPTVFESRTTAERLSTVHYTYRTEAGDKRKWGSPWYVFFGSDSMEKTGDVITKKPAVVNGELIKKAAEEYIREKLGIGSGVEETPAPRSDAKKN